MSIENSIGTIKKAVEEKAFMDASDEGHEKANAEHYKKVFEEFKAIKELDPEKLEKFIGALSTIRDMKIELGQELGQLFSVISNKIMEKKKEKIHAAIDKIVREEPSGYTQLEKISAVMLHEAEFADEEIKDDPEIIAAFAGKETLLNKALSLKEASVQIFEMLGVISLIREEENKKRLELSN